jgi:hypothetical protein
MIGILFAVATGIMFLMIIIEEHTRAHNLHALYLVRFDSKPVTKAERLQAVAEELTLNTKVTHIVTHGCIICREKEQLWTMEEALAHRQRVREAAFI